LTSYNKPDIFCLMKTYIDVEVVAKLKAIVAEEGTYRAAADRLKVDYVVLHKVVNGKWKLPEKMAQAAGFEPVPQPERKWRRQVNYDAGGMRS